MKGEIPTCSTGVEYDKQMKISVFYDHILQACEQSGKGILTLVREVKAAGVDGVELRLSYLLEHPEVLEWLGDAKLDISCLYDFYDMPGMDEREHAKKHINLAALLGVQNILVVPGFISDENDVYGQVSKMLDSLSFMVSYAKEKNVTVTIEDFDDGSSPISTIGGVNFFLESVPGLKHTFDCGNYAYSDENALEAFKTLGEHITHIHCKDRGEEENVLDKGLSNNRGLMSVAVGDGYIPIKTIVEGMMVSGYEGWLAIEHFDLENQRDGIKRSAEYLKSFT